MSSHFSESRGVPSPCCYVTLQFQKVLSTFKGESSPMVQGPNSTSTPGFQEPSREMAATDIEVSEKQRGWASLKWVHNTLAYDPVITQELEKASLAFGAIHFVGILGSEPEECLSNHVAVWSTRCCRSKAGQKWVFGFTHRYEEELGGVKHVQISDLENYL